MATRQFDFTGSIVDTSSQPTVEDATADGDVPNWGQTAESDSWYTSQAGIAGVRAIVAAKRADQQIVFSSATQKFYEFVTGDSGVDDGDLILEPDDSPAAPDGRWLQVPTGGGGGSTSAIDIVYELDNLVSTIKAAESLADRDAVSLVRYDGGNGFMVNKAQATTSRFQNSFIGFSKGAVTGTQGSYTLTLDAALVTGNVISVDVNGRTKSVTFASSSDETLETLAAAIAGDDDIDPTTDSVQAGADKLGNDDRVINVFGGSGKNAAGYLTVVLDNISITGGASQAGFVAATSVAAASNTVDVHRLGELGSFTGLMEGPAYYLSASTAGAISDTVTNKLVGYGLSTTVLLVEPDSAPVPADLSKIWFTHHGATSNTNDNGTDTIEGFDFTSWSAAYTASGTIGFETGMGDLCFAGQAYALERRQTASVVNTLNSFNKASWSAIATRSLAQVMSGAASYSGKLVAGGGSTDTGYNTGTDDLFSFNGTSWVKDGDLLTQNRVQVGAFTEGGFWRRVNGADSSAFAAGPEHNKWNGSSMSNDTTPTSAGNISGSVSPAGGMFVRHTPNPDDSQEWSGTSWGSQTALAQEHSNDQTRVAAPGRDGTTTTYMNGGNLGAGSLALTDEYTGTSWASGTSSTLSKRNHTGGTI